MQVRLAGKENIYLEIAGQYKRYIESGVLKTGEKLPSCRALACELGINPNTVERAYSILEEDGYILNLPKKGAFVTERANKLSERRDAAAAQLRLLKNAGFTYEQLIEILNIIYGLNGEVK